MLLQPLTVVPLGQVDLMTALHWQDEMAARLAAGHGDDLLALAEHAPVYTAGRSMVLAPTHLHGIPIRPVARAGGLIYHGPGQLVGYMLRHLARDGGEPDVTGHVRGLRQALTRTCEHLGVAVSARPGQAGLWAADGGQVTQVAAQIVDGVTRFGFTLNVRMDLAPVRAASALVGNQPLVSSLAQNGYTGNLDPAAAALVAAVADVFGYITGDTHWVAREESMWQGDSEL